METEHEAVVATQMRSNAITFVEGHPVAIVPTETKLIDLEPYLPAPLKKRAKVNTQDAESFIRYVNEHKNDSTRIFANVTESGAAFNAMIDYHETGDGASGRGFHSVGYSLAHSVEWKRWKTRDGQKFTQKEFAKFVEDNLMNIISPTGGDMLDITLTLEATTAVNFKKGIRLQNGNEQLIYQETTQAKAGQAGELEIPKMISIVIPVFERWEPTQIDLRLRYNINDGQLTFSYEMVSPHKIIESVIGEIIDDIGQNTGIDPFRGNVTMA